MNKYPPERVLDFFTRTDELLIQNIEAIKELRRYLAIPVAAPVTPKLREQLLTGTKREYEVKTFTMASSRSDELVRIEGDFIHAWTDGDLAGCGVRLNNKACDILYFSRRNPVKLRYFEFFLTHPAQAAKTLDLMIGREASAEAFTAEVSVTTMQKFNTISTDKDTHFTDAIAQAAKEDENLTGLLGNKIRLTNISIISAQPLDFYLFFYNTDGFDDADLDLDTFCGMVELDLATYGKRLGSAQYYHSLEGLQLDYEDEDATNELHVALYNASATGKNAGATGEVAIQFKYELRA